MIRAAPLLCCAALFLANWYTCRRLFTTEYLRHMHSIEAAYIALTRYTAEHWGDLGWFSLWYGGMPFQNAYQPGLPMISAAVASLSGWSPAHAYHWTIAAMYCLGGVSVFLMAWGMTGALRASFAAALAYSLFSPSVLLMQSVRADLGVWEARRYMALVYYGEGPNVSGLTLLPLGLLGIHRVYTRGGAVDWLLAAFALAATVLVSWPAGVAMALGAVAYLLARPAGEAARRLPALIALAVVAYALLSPWTPPSTVRANQINAQHIGEYPWTTMQLAYWGAVAVLLAAFRWTLRRWRAPWFLQFSVFFFALTGSIALSADWQQIHLLPQPERFHLAMEIPIALAAIFGSKSLLDRWPRLQWIFASLLVIFTVHQLRVYRFYNRNLAAPFDISNAVEYRLAHWLDTHHGDRRVFAPGSIAFWMNAWTDTPQMTGCCLPGLPNWTNVIAAYIITSDDGAGERAAGISLLWLKAFGAHAVATGGPASKEHYRDFVHPYKFEGKLPVLWKEGDDTLYRVPQRSASLARVVRREDLVARPPVNGIDVAGLGHYVAALDDVSLPLAEFEWKGAGRAEVTASLEPGQVLSIQQTWHPGWRASANGRPVPVRADGLGQMTIEPGCSRCAIELRFDGGAEMRWCYAASAAALLLLLGRFAKRKRLDRAIA